MIQVNQNRMEQLMRAFYTLTGIRIVLFDNELIEIMSYPPQHCDFCHFMRKNPQFLQRCTASDRAAFQACKKADGPVTYVCHAGLTEAVVQLTEEDAVIGYIMFGQVIPEETARPTRVKLSQICMENGAPHLLGTVSSMPGKSAQEIRAAATILESLSVYMWSNRVVALPRKEFLSMLDRYIDEHLSEPIKAEEICAYFGIRRTHLYKLASRYLECSVSAYIRKRRIRKACRLLRENGLPITEIAFLTGFSDYNYFSKCFRAETGMSANQYRKEQSGRP